MQAELILLIVLPPRPPPVPSVSKTYNCKTSGFSNAIESDVCVATILPCSIFSCCSAFIVAGSALFYIITVVVFLSIFARCSQIRQIATVFADDRFLHRHRVIFLRKTMPRCCCMTMLGVTFAVVGSLRLLCLRTTRFRSWIKYIYTEKNYK